jgi:acyl-coenzyme A synthetase/AMP-(fatty) acid ligase
MTFVTIKDHRATGETIRFSFDRAVRDFAEKTLIVSDLDGSVFTYADAARVVRRIMAWLQDAGVQKGDRICIYAPMDVEPCFLFWAAANLGVIFVPMDFHSRGDERLAAFIVPDASPVHTEEIFRDLRLHIKDELGSHEVPADFILKDALPLPRNSTGKCLQKQLRYEIIDPFIVSREGTIT